MQKFYSNGKLLLTGEYVVLDGAKALALPTKYGQTLSIEKTDTPDIKWKSIDHNGITWFESTFPLYAITEDTLSTENTIASRLLQILKAAKTLNPHFLEDETGYTVNSVLDFPRNWGLGSSSTLLNNIAQWAKVNPFKLSDATFGGSGYDIACASNNTPIIYYLQNQNPSINPLSFNPSFKNAIHFIHLNQKQDSREAIKTYQEHKKHISNTIARINSITNRLQTCDSLESFETLIHTHESLIGDITSQTPIKERIFKDYKHAIKSLGGWGGDFILATGETTYVNSYFTSKGYTTIIPFSTMIL